MPNKQAGRPPIDGKGRMTQAERQSRWRANQRLKAIELTTAGNGKKSRINLALRASTLDGIDLLAKDLSTSKTHVIEILLARGLKEAAPIVDSFFQLPPRSEDDEVSNITDLKWLCTFLRQGYSLSELDFEYEEFAKDEAKHCNGRR